MDQAQGGVKQPWLGILGAIFTILLAFTVFIWFTPDGFGAWVTWFAIAMIPTEIILSLVWQNNYPPPASTLTQPLKGMYLFSLIVIAALIVGGWSLKFVGGFITPPTPFLNFFIILTVVVTLWCVVVFQCWPAAAVKAHPAFVGIGTLVVAYVVTWIIFQLFFDFTFAEKAPWYVAALDPKGAFMGWKAMAFAVTTVGVILAMVMFDFWPISSWAKKSPGVGKQPIFGIIAGIYILIWSYIVWLLFVRLGGMDVVIFMVRVPVCWIFGEFIMLLCMQTYPFQTTKQPARGVWLTIFAVILCIVMYYVYSGLSAIATGGLPSGPPAYAHELWLASALLGCTFPMMVVYTNFFNFWPLTEPAPAPPPK